VLHFAAEKCIKDRLKNLSNIEYITSDISPQIKADIIMDITNIPCNSNSIDVIICNHVLEHVLDDIRAMEELYRVLKLGGWALLDVPFDKKRKKTFEDPLITSWEERERVFGQGDHVRIYGLDYKKRLENTGFVVEVIPFWQEIDSKTMKQYCISKQDINFCKK